MPLVKRKLTNKSIIEKCKALKDLETGMSNKEVAKKYGVPKNTLSTWIKNKTKLLTSLEKNGTKSKRKKLRIGNFKNVDKAIYTWFVAKRSQQVPIDGTILKEKALKFAEALGELDFKASDCWFHNWKERNGISFKIISGESAAVTNNMTASWNETTLPTLLLNYKLENFFNADEFGLFYQCLPNKTYHLSRENCFGGKNSKVRLTGIAAGSATGEKLPMFVIGKSKNPRCFKHIKQLPCTYKNQLKSWMTGDLFTEWVMKLDSFFRAQDRKVALLVDNCSAHPHIEGLSNINLIFFPPNTTSVLQPMDQGVIRSLKAQYRHKIVRLCIKAVDKNEPMPKISILQAMKDLVSSWNAVSKETVINCFKKAEELNRLRELDPRAVQEDLSAESYIGLDCDVVTTGSLATDAEIIAQILDPNFENDDNEVEDSVDEAIDVKAPPRPSDIQLEIAFETIQNASLYSSKYGNEIQSLALKLEDLMKMEKMDNLKQYQITDFFQKL
ncbi:tigger transposable element-derived protein 4-like [Hydra vulgaris]|uniref:Tigger transposable element-derived protein 4-like n=1 Tax=Hydra vulgaris TaxID=6087 RepID=A0ABM4B1R6_HYDVU